MARKTSTLKVGELVVLTPRKDGVGHRDGDDAVWEVIEVNFPVTTIHLCGAGRDRRAAVKATADAYTGPLFNVVELLPSGRTTLRGIHATNAGAEEHAYNLNTDLDEENHHYVEGA